MRCWFVLRCAPHRDSFKQRVLLCAHEWFMDYKPANTGPFAPKIERYCRWCGTRQYEALIGFDPATGHCDERKWVNL